VNAVVLSREFAVEMERTFAAILPNPTRSNGISGGKAFIAKDQGVVYALILPLAVNITEERFSKVTKVKGRHDSL